MHPKHHIRSFRTYEPPTPPAPTKAKAKKPRKRASNGRFQKRAKS